MSEVKQPDPSDARRRVNNLAIDVDEGPVKSVPEPYEADESGYRTFTATAEYVVNRATGKIHRRFLIEGLRQHADFPRCNLDQIAERSDVATREEVAALFWPRRKPSPCLRCFPKPTPDDEREDASIPIDETPDSDPQAEQMPVDQMDPEDAQAVAESQGY